jgi:starvation-inducible DNA-binding protein
MGISALEAHMDLSQDSVEQFSSVLRELFALYMKTKNFHWHLSGHHFRDYHLLLDEHGTNSLQ